MTAPRPPSEPRPRRGEIWWVGLDPTIGSETRKTRPCLVVGTDSLRRLPIRIVVPLTSRRDKHEGRPWCVRLPADTRNRLRADSAAGTVQVRAVSTRRFKSRIGRASPDSMSGVRAALALCLDLTTPGA